MKFSLKNLFLFLLPFFLFACGQEGAASDQQAFWQSIVSEVVAVVFVLATPILLLLLRKLMKVMEAKWGVDISTAQEELVMGVVRQGISFAEERSRKALKEGKDPMPGDEKKIEAVKFISSKLESLGVLGWGADALEGMVESALHMKREDPNDPTPLAVPEK